MTDTTTLTPPDPSTGPSTGSGQATGAGAEPPAPRPGGAAKTIAILTAITGAVILFISVAAGVVGIVARAVAPERVNDVQTVAASGIDSLDVDAEASSFVIEFGDVDEATLDITDSRGGWSLQRDGSELTVSRDNPWSDGISFGDWWGPDESVTLTLPTSLQGSLDTDLSLTAGSLEVWGGFGDMNVDVSAGNFELRGEVTSLGLGVSAGNAEVNADVSTSASFDISAGYVTSTFAGSAPSDIDIDVSAGHLALTVPEGTYDVQSNVDGGDLDNRLRPSEGSTGTITVDLSAGGVVLDSE
ncbi:MAG: hypothetical protein QM607_11915 [Microbacterium sp.]